MNDTASGLYPSITVPKVQPISDIIKNLEAITCDVCQRRLASYDVYVDSGIANNGLVLLLFSMLFYCFFISSLHYHKLERRSIMTNTTAAIPALAGIVIIHA